ncbi:MAG: hypothetical protein PVJ67_01020 [Candidatus Pacearchaeota archaeon]|jgi:hypothetical protein
MNFIKKIFNGESDELVHLQFQKFSKGEFRNKAIVEVKKTGKGFTIKTSAEFANELVRIMAERLGDAETRVTGAIVSTSDLTGKLEFKDKKQFQGVKRYLIDTNLTGKQILDMLDEFPKNFFALSFKFDGEQLKIKPKAPKSGKPGKEKEGGPKADFCSLKTSDEKIAKSFVIEKDNFKEAKFNHTFFIDELVMPEGETDYAKIREMAKRKGRVVRTGVIDSEEVRSEKEFLA